MKNEKGITLIALIITIIIMLILVIVTISFAMNGGLFQKAKEGADKTNIAIDKEQLGNLIVSNMNIDTLTIPSNLGTLETRGTTWTVTAAEEGGDIIITLTDEEDNTITYNLEDDLGVRGVSVEQAYSFKFNQLGEPIEIGTDTARFSTSAFWEVVGKDLSIDPKYGFDDGDILFFIESSDPSVHDGWSVIFGISSSSDSGYIMTVMEDGEGSFVQIGIMACGDSPDISMSTFLETYGNVVFTFQDVSEIEFPTGG